MNRSRNFDELFTGLHILRRHKPIACVVGDEIVTVQVEGDLNEQQVASVRAAGWEQEKADTFTYKRGAEER